MYPETVNFICENGLLLLATFSTIGLGLLKLRVDKLKAENSRLLQRNKQLEELAGTDYLTGLANRRALDTELRRATLSAIRKGPLLGVLIIDVDKFKNVNDTHGHEIGDAALKQISQILVKNSRANDTPARYAGDEFALLVDNPSAPSDLDVVAERIRVGVTEIDFNPGLSVSIGGAYLNIDKPNELIRNADEALYEAKNGGRNRVVIRH